MRTRAAVLSEVGRIDEVDQELPPLKPGDVLVRVDVTGLCGSDMAVYLGKHAYKKPPIVLGHEFAGTVREVGSAVTGVAVGDRVCAASFSPCDRCPDCLRGAIHLCRHKRNICDNKWDGSFARHVIASENMLSLLPPGLGDEAGALVEPLTIGLHAIRVLSGVQNRTMAVIGAGSIGLACLVCAKQLGAGRAVCIDTGPVKRAQALALGADAYVDADTQPAPGPAAAVQDLLGAGADITVVACSYPEVFAHARQMTRPGGEVLVVAYTDPGVQLPLNDFLRAEIAVRFSYLSTRADFKDVIGWLAAGEIDPSPLVTHRFPLGGVAQGAELKRTQPRTVGKVLFDMRAA